MYTQLSPIPLPPRQNQKLLLEIAETFFDIGTDLLRKQSLDGAVRYLRWSWDYILKLLTVENLTVDATELSVNIRHNLAKSLIRRGIGDEADLERARELVEGLVLDAPKEHWMYLLKLEYLEKKGGAMDAVFASIFIRDILTKLSGR